MPQLKKANKRNLKQIAKIYATEFSKPPYEEPWDYETANKKIKLFSKYCDIWKVVNEENETIGFTIINPNFWFPGKVAFAEQTAIMHKYQGQGIGRKIREEIFEIYRKRGFKKVMGITNKNSKAYGSFKNVGMKESKDNVLLEKDLE